jgi:hypothetical protein
MFVPVALTEVPQMSHRLYLDHHNRRSLRAGEKDTVCLRLQADPRPYYLSSHSLQATAALYPTLEAMPRLKYDAGANTRNLPSVSPWSLANRYGPRVD